MREDLETLRSLCRCLRQENGDLSAFTKNEWRAVIDLANQHYLTPALTWALEQKNQLDRLPEDARGFLNGALDLNKARNGKIRAQAAELLDALTEAGLRSVVLKGGIYLFEADEEAVSTRMMVDLDVLVPEECLDASAKVAGTLGYEVLEESDELFQHIDPLGRPGDLASVEIHRHVGMQRRVLPAEEVLRDAIAVDYDGQTYHVPTPTHRAIHAIFHSEVQAQSNYALGRIPLRYLHDLILLRGKHEHEIDWGEVAQRLSARGYGHFVPGFLLLAERLFGLPMPTQVPKTWRTRRHYDWCLAQVKWPALRALVSVFGGLAHPFRRPPVEYVYGENCNILTLQINRLRYLWYLASAYRGGSLAKISEVSRRMRRA